MTIDARFNMNSIAGKLRDGAYEVAESTTVAGFMELAQHEAGYKLTDEQKASCVFIFNNSPAFYETELSESGKLRVMFKILGG